MHTVDTRSLLALLTGCVLLTAAWPADGTAQDRAPLAPDRPGFGDGTAVVTPQTLQAETGYALNADGSSTTLELGQLLLRYGLTHNVELRGYANSYVVADGSNGYTGTGLGAKWKLFQTDLVQLSTVAALALPTGTGPFKSFDDRARQEVRLAFDGALGSTLTFSANGGVSFYYTGTSATSWLFTPSLSTPLNARTGFYVGYAGFYSETTDTNWVESGLTYLVSPDTQLDLNTGLQLDAGSDLFFVGLGLAHRF